MKALIKAVPTGRQWGDKREEDISNITIAGVKCVVRVNDSWEGGIPDDGVIQQYWRMTWLEYPKPSYP